MTLSPFRMNTYGTAYSPSRGNGCFHEPVSQRTASFDQLDGDRGLRTRLTSLG
jgi:hypothetical protein